MSLNTSLTNYFSLKTSIKNVRIDSVEIHLLYLITFVGIVVNLLTMLCLILIPSYRLKSSCFLFHHCLICLTLSLLIYPYSLSFTIKGIRCDYLGNLQVTCVTAELLNMAAMVASEAYRFEDLIHQESSSGQRRTLSKKEVAVVSSSTKEIKSKSSLQSEENSHRKCVEEKSFEIDEENRNDFKLNSSENPHYFQYQYDHQGNHSTISCGCLSFGILIIWFSSVILHLGITMIGSESKSYFDPLGQFCNFVITDIRGYVLTLMWIIITIFSLIITIRYIHKILKEVSLKRRHHQPLLSLTIFGQSHGQSIASRDILMQQIQQRIQLNIILIVLFILFWFPLFIVTLCDIKFKISERFLRYLLIIAWSNSSLSPLTYCLLFPKCNDFCSFRWKKDRSTTYDSLTSYYNRIGDRFHDISKWDQYQQNDDQQQQQQRREEEEKEEEEEMISNENQIHRNRNRNRSRNETKENSLIVKEISSLSSSSHRHSTKRSHQSNGLIVTTKSEEHF